MVEQPDMFWFIVSSLMLANVVMLIFGLTGIKAFVKIVAMPGSVLLPVILLLSIVGAYAVSNSPNDVYWMLGFGVFGYFLRAHGYPLGPVILGIILSRLPDDYWRRAIILDQESLWMLLKGTLTTSCHWCCSCRCC